MPIVKKMGLLHQGKGIEAAHYDVLCQAVLMTIEELLAGTCSAPLLKAWKITIETITTVMKNAKEDEDVDETGREDGTTRPMVGNQLSSREKIAVEQQDLEDMKAFKASHQNPDQQKEMKDHFASLFRKEVDFHHKVAYRFEKAYRLGKKWQERKQTLNIEIIDCISEHSGYIEQDPMALFYCLFFCIYYKN